MASVTVYSPTERLAPVTTAKQQMVSGGFGEGIGESLQRAGGAVGQYAKAKDAYEARVDEAQVMEWDTQIAERSREVEGQFLALRGRNAMDGAAAADEAWDAMAAEFAAQATTPRQRQMLGVQLGRRRENWAGRRDTHAAREGEVWQAGAEDASLAAAVSEALETDPFSPERSTSFLLVGGRLDNMAARRGWSPEERARRGREAISGIHIATIQQLRNESGVQALNYMRQHEESIDPVEFAKALPEVQTVAWREGYTLAARGEFAPGGSDVDVTVDGNTRRETIRPPLTDYDVGPGNYNQQRTRPDGTTYNHEGRDLARPTGTPVFAALSGTASIKNDPDGYGTYVEIDHGGGRVTRYAHLSGTTIQPGPVRQGERIGLVGSTGRSTGPHLHFELIENGAPVDPTAALGSNVPAGGSGPLRTAMPTIENIEDWVTRAVPEGASFREREVAREAGMTYVREQIALRNGRDSEGDRRYAEWQSRNPGSNVNEAPADVIDGMSPEKLASERNAAYRAANPDAGEVDPDLRVATFNGLLDDARDPARQAAFRRTDFSGPGWGDILTPGQRTTLAAMQRSMDVQGPAGSRSPQALVSSVAPIRDAYLRQTRIPPTPSGRTAEQARTVARIDEEMYLYASDILRLEQREPSPEELEGRLRQLLIPVRPDDGGDRLVPLAANPDGNVVISDRMRTRVRGTLRDRGINNPTIRQITDEYMRQVGNGQIVQPWINRYGG